MKGLGGLLRKGFWGFVCSRGGEEGKGKGIEYCFSFFGIICSGRFLKRFFLFVDERKGKFYYRFLFCLCYLLY